MLLFLLLLCFLFVCFFIINIYLDLESHHSKVARMSLYSLCNKGF